MHILQSRQPSVANALLDLLWPGARPVGFRMENHVLHVSLVPREPSGICPHCGCRDIKPHSSVCRTAVDALLYPHQTTVIEYRSVRYRCMCCAKTFVDQPSFLMPRAKVTNNMKLYAQQLLRRPTMTISDVSRLMGLSWRTLQLIDREQLEYCFEHLNLTGLTNIAIDEFSVHKNHRYATVVIDNDTGYVIWIGLGKSKDSVRPFFDMLKQRGIAEQIRSVACDQNAAYPALVRENLPNAAIIYDFFHVMSHWRADVLKEAKKVSYLRAEKRIRLQTHQNCEADGVVLSKSDIDSRVKKATRSLAGIDWLMVRHEEDLTRQNKTQLLDVLTEDNALLAALHPVTESIRQLWKIKDQRESERYLKNIVSLLLHIGRKFVFKPAKGFAMMLRRPSDGITKGYTTSRLEGANNKIKVLKRTGYGFRNLEYFFLKIKSILSGKTALPMFEKISGKAVINGRLWQGAWSNCSSLGCCFHTQV